MCTFFGLNLLLLISPDIAMGAGVTIIFYGLYYGVLGRDCAEICTERMAAKMGVRTYFMLWDYSFSTYAKFSEKPIFLTPWCAYIRTNQGVRNLSFSENFAYLLNEWFHYIYKKKYSKVEKCIICEGKPLADGKRYLMC